MHSAIANVLDLEHDEGRIIEIGLTTVDLRTRTILKTYDLPISDVFCQDDRMVWEPEVSPKIQELTGWTAAKLRKQGIPFLNACNRLRDKYGGRGRLLVVDHDKDREMLIEEWKWHRVKTKGSLNEEWHPLGMKCFNVTMLFDIVTRNFGEYIGLDKMLDHFDLKFEGRRHRAADDSRNIARLFIELLDRFDVIHAEPFYP